MRIIWLAGSVERTSSGKKDSVCIGDSSSVFSVYFRVFRGFTRKFSTTEITEGTENTEPELLSDLPSRNDIWTVNAIRHSQEVARR